MAPALRNKLLALSAGSAMTLTLALIGGHHGLEGRKYTAYFDVVGVLTVCDGHTGQDMTPDKRYSDRECDEVLKKDLAPVFAAIESSVKVPIPDSRKAALASFGDNVGIRAMIQSTLVKKLNAGEIQAACDELRRWIRVGGKEWKGLINRREVELELCLKN
ncbi:lysozyme [Yersinia nurmii]|uniref:Lysozyme n=1 Tax=Yersinia nurmii TaxID=685706 RepID=A0AAW7K1N3_9GAMM|nr:lysozyme [Yersinia nurmii]MDN0086009.1 lysozyme [Yersinia nurmii]